MYLKPAISPKDEQVFRQHSGNAVCHRYQPDERARRRHSPQARNAGHRQSRDRRCPARVRRWSSRTIGSRSYLRAGDGTDYLVMMGRDPGKFLRQIPHWISTP